MLAAEGARRPLPGGAGAVPRRRPAARGRRRPDRHRPRRRPAAGARPQRASRRLRARGSRARRSRSSTAPRSRWSRPRPRLPSSPSNPIAQREDIAESSDDTPAVKLVHATLAQAIEDGASDIHFEPQEDDMIVRARIDGVTRQVAQIPKQMQLGVISRLKIMGNLDIAERRAPQDGRVSIRFHGNPLDLRIAIMPTTYGEQVVLRIMHRAVSKPDLSELGMTDAAREHFEKAIRQPYGAVVVCGPTGSGKTTTLYTALHLLNNPGHVRDDDRGPGRGPDPRESTTSRSRRRAASPSPAGCARSCAPIPTCCSSARSATRRRRGIAMQAGMTGHLVLTTVHAHNAASAIERLKDMGVEPGLLANAVNCIVAQRLARRLCTDCREAYWPTDEELESMGMLERKGEVYLHHSKGCGRCGGTGYPRPCRPLRGDAGDAVEIRRLRRRADGRDLQCRRRQGHDHAAPGRPAALPRGRLLARRDPPRDRRAALTRECAVAGGLRRTHLAYCGGKSPLWPTAITRPEESTTKRQLWCCGRRRNRRHGRSARATPPSEPRRSGPRSGPL